MAEKSLMPKQPATSPVSGPGPMPSNVLKGPAPAGEIIKDTTTATFMQDVIEVSKTVPVIVDFWAPWCGPCKQLTPILEKVVRAAKGAVRLVKMNIDDHPQVAGQLGVQSIPAVFAFKDGRPIDAFAGALPESQLKTFVQKLIGEDVVDEIAEVLKSGDAALAEGDVQGAAEIYAAVLEHEKDNVEAICGLANCLIMTGEFDEAEAMLKRVPIAKQTLALVAGVRAKLDLARKAPSAKEIQKLEAAIAATPADYESRFQLALALNANGDKTGAAEQLLEIFRRNRTWNDEAARKQLVQFFDAWGPKDEATLAGRKQLSALFFS